PTAVRCGRRRPRAARRTYGYGSRAARRSPRVRLSHQRLHLGTVAAFVDRGVAPEAVGHEVVELFLRVLAPDLQGYEMALAPQGFGGADGRGNVARLVHEQRDALLRGLGGRGRRQDAALGEDRDEPLEPDR